MKSKTFALALLILWPLALSAAPDPNTGHFKNLSVTGTASANELVVTNGLTLGGVRVLATNLFATQFGITMGDGVNVISTGAKGYARIPRDLTVTGWSIAASPSGSVVIDTFLTNSAAFPPVNTSIWAGAPPTLSGNVTNSATGLSINTSQGDWIGYTVNSAATVTRVYLTIYGHIR